MSATVLEHKLLPGCAVAAILKRADRGIEWREFIAQTRMDSQINWAIELTDQTAAVGHASSLAAFKEHISAFAPLRYSLTSPVEIMRRPFATSGEAEGRFFTLSCSADTFGHVVIRAAPIQGAEAVRLTIPQSDAIAPGIHEPDVANGILNGVCLALLDDDYSRPFVGCQVTVMAARWHEVDSWWLGYQRAARMAMLELLGREAAAE